MLENGLPRPILSMPTRVQRRTLGRRRSDVVFSLRVDRLEVHMLLLSRKCLFLTAVTSTVVTVLAAIAFYLNAG